MRWVKTSEKQPNRDGAYMITDGEVTTFGTFSTALRQWNPVTKSKISTILWWKELPYYPSATPDAHGDIDDMGEYLYEQYG